MSCSSSGSSPSRVPSSCSSILARWNGASWPPPRSSCPRAGCRAASSARERPSRPCPGRRPRRRRCRCPPRGSAPASSGRAGRRGRPRGRPRPARGRGRARAAPARGARARPRPRPAPRARRARRRAHEHAVVLVAGELERARELGAPLGHEAPLVAQHGRQRGDVAVAAAAARLDLGLEPAAVAVRRARGDAVEAELGDLLAPAAHHARDAHLREREHAPPAARRRSAAPRASRSSPAGHSATGTSAATSASISSRRSTPSDGATSCLSVSRTPSPVSRRRK